MQGRQNIRNNMLTLRIARLTVGVATLVLIIANIFFLRDPEVWIAVGVLLVITIAVSIFPDLLSVESKKNEKFRNCFIACFESQLGTGYGNNDD